MTASVENVHIEPKHLRISLSSKESLSYPHFFLRENCRCSECLHDLTQQRLVDPFTIPLDVKPIESQVDAAAVQLTWPDGHKSQYPTRWLVSNAFDKPAPAPTDLVDKVYWTAAEGETLHPSVAYEKVMASDEGVLEWVWKIEKYGFCFVPGCPVTPEATEKLSERIAFTRETHYGRFWDFTSNFAHSDLAYSSVPLNMHTDTTYFSDPIKLQLFHLLSARSTHQGGHSTLVDGFLCAQKLKESSPTFYELLSTLPVPAHASGGDHTLFRPVADKPVFEHDGEGRLLMIRFNQDDRGLVGRGPQWQGTVKLDDGQEVDKVTAFYAALRAWETLLRSPEYCYEFPMQPGEPFVFDNQRVLHGRTGFSGSRRLCGTYVNGDDYYNRLRTLHRKFKEQPKLQAQAEESYRES